MAVYSPVSKDEVISLINQYDIGNLVSYEGILEGIENTNYKIQTTNNNYILTIFEKRVDPKDLPFFINLKNHLTEKKFFCPTPIKTKEGKNINLFKGKSCIFITFLKGSKVSKVLDLHCEEVGRALSLLHKNTSDFYQERINNMSHQKWQEIFDKSIKYSDNKYHLILKEIERELLFLKKSWPINLPKGIIHADVFQDNVFFKGNKFSGLIDFYFSCNDFFSYDIALTINAWCFNDSFNFKEKRFKSLIKGYESLRKLTNNEKKYLSILLRGASLRILLTRIHDQIFYEKGAFVTLKNPEEYISILRFHQNNNIANLL